MNTLPERYQSGLEGQFLERKSCFNKRGRMPKPLPLKKVSAEIAETLVAFANADGGELIVGLNDDGAPSGLPFNDKQLAKLIAIPSTRIEPPLSDKKLSQNQMRLLAMARQQEGRFTSAQYQKLAALDIYTASKGRLVNSDLRRIWGVDRQAALRRIKGLLESGWLVAKGYRRGRCYLAGPKAG